MPSDAVPDEDAGTAAEGAAGGSPPPDEGAGHVPRVLFVCVENACRSQMAEAFGRRHGSPGVEVFSAGSDPADRVNPRTEELMAERGVPLSDAAPTPVAELPGGRYDVVVSMGCGDRCPSVPADRRVEWELPDPAELSDEGFREVRDEIEGRVRGLLRSLARTR